MGICPLGSRAENGAGRGWADCLRRRLFLEKGAAGRALTPRLLGRSSSLVLSHRKPTRPGRARADARQTGPLRALPGRCDDARGSETDEPMVGGDVVHNEDRRAGTGAITGCGLVWPGRDKPGRGLSAAQGRTEDAGPTLSRPNRRASLNSNPYVVSHAYNVHLSRSAATTGDQVELR